MNLFDTLVTEALNNKKELAQLRIVVEKELLHQDILRIMQDHDFLRNLTFIGGTCLRTCYGSTRLSEDLDFTGGADFTRDTLVSLADLIISTLQEKYGLAVSVTAPEKDIFNVDTWKIKVVTRPEKKHVPTQRINLDICAVPSYEKVPLLVRNPYTVGADSAGLIITGQSREEIFTDKLLAFALRPNRIKYRDVWDMMWLHSTGISPRLSLIAAKLADRHRSTTTFLESFHNRCAQLATSTTAPQEFEEEMQRFLPNLQHTNPAYWHVLVTLIKDLESKLKNTL